MRCRSPPCNSGPSVLHPGCSRQNHRSHRVALRGCLGCGCRRCSLRTAVRAARRLATTQQAARSPAPLRSARHLLAACRRAAHIPPHASHPANRAPAKGFPPTRFARRLLPIPAALSRGAVAAPAPSMQSLTLRCNRSRPHLCGDATITGCGPRRCLMHPTSKDAVRQ